MRGLIGLIVGAVIGGAIGWSGILCSASGQCAITGSWYGGAIVGGLIGFFLLSGCPCCAGRCKTASSPDQSTDATTSAPPPPPADPPNET